MRDNRSNRGAAPYDAGYGYGEQPSGFNRHQASNSRQIATENPVVSAAKGIAGAVSGFFQNRGAQAAQPRAVAGRSASSLSASGDYLGVGEPCRSCGNPVDATQDRCTHCGAFVKPLFQNFLFWIVTGVLLVLVVLFTLAANSCNPISQGDPSNSDNPGYTPSGSDASNAATLSAALASAQSMLDQQAASRTCTHLSINALQDAVDAGNAVLSNKDATEDQIAAAAKQVSNAISSMVTIVSVQYAWPWYNEELLSDPAGWTGRQIALNGTAQAISDNGDGTCTAVLAINADSNCLVYVTYYPGDNNGKFLAVNNWFNAYGVMTGILNGYPTMFADYIEVG